MESDLLIDNNGWIRALSICRGIVSRCSSPFDRWQCVALEGSCSWKVEHQEHLDIIMVLTQHADIKPKKAGVQWLDVRSQTIYMSMTR